VCVSTFQYKNDWFLEQQINVKLSVKSENNASNICAMFSKDYGGDGMQKSSNSKWHV
jgi:hypothetical protein